MTGSIVVALWVIGAIGIGELARAVLRWRSRRRWRR